MDAVFLLLLLCPLSAAELLNNEVSGEEFAGIHEENFPGPEIPEENLPEPEILEENFPGPEIPEENFPGPNDVKVLDPATDLQAALRDVTVQLSENRRMIQRLQAQNRAQAAELRNLKSWSSATENALRRQKSVGPVAFSASLRISGSEHLGPFPSYTTLVFKHLISNFGNAYNTDTGMFKAPVRGAYHFEFYCIGGGPVATAVGLLKNGNHVVLAHEAQSDGWGTTANAATLYLEPGDVVFLRLWPDRRVFDSGNHYTTFSGRLLFAL